MHIAFFVKFFLLENIVYVSCYYSAVSQKQIRHLLLRKPYCFIFQSDLQFD